MPNEFLQNKLLIICGPTATGKTQLGIRLAKKFSSRGRPASGWNGEIVSADSRQVYQGMDIGTGKDLPVNSKFQIPNSKFREFNLGCYLFDGIPIWLYDVAEPDQLFSAADYYRLAWRVIEDIWQRRKLPILVGGTGFYIKAVVEGIGSLGISPDWELRKILGDKDIKILGEELKKLDLKRWERMNESDRKNSRRLIRAIEIAISNKKLATQMTQKKNREHREDVLFIGLMAPLKILYQRIDERVEQMIRAGLEKEVKNLLQKGYGWDLPAMSGVGYAEWRPYFEKKAILEQVAERIKFDSHAYARRQMTWFKKALRQAQDVWFDITERGWENRVVKLVSGWYTS